MLDMRRLAGLPVVDQFLGSELLALELPDWCTTTNISQLGTSSNHFLQVQSWCRTFFTQIPGKGSAWLAFETSWGEAVATKRRLYPRNCGLVPCSTFLVLV